MLILKHTVIFSRNFLLYILLLLSSVFQTRSQPVIFNRVSSPETSYFGLINDITQDQQGYMWIATWSQGLYRYDGYHVLNYMNDPADSNSLMANTLQAVCADRSGTIWIGTQNSGLDRLDSKTGIVTHLRHEKGNLKSLSDDRITTILGDHDGTIWIGTMNGLNRLDEKTKTFTRFYYNPNDSTSLSHNYVQVLYEDRSHTLWVGTRSEDDKLQGKGGLNRLDQKSGRFIRYQHNPGDPHSLVDNSIGAILEDSKGNFWVSTLVGGLYKMDRKNGTFERHLYDSANTSNLSIPPRKKEVTPDINLFFICEDGRGDLWIGASSGWITRYDPKTKKATHFDSINNDLQAAQSVSGGFTSKEGVFWITTWSGNIYRVDPFHNIIPHYSIGSIVHAIHEDLSGALWIGTFLGEGLLRLDRAKGSIKRYLNGSSPDKIHDITALYEGKDSTLWIGTDNGLYHFDKNKQTFKPYKNDPKDETSLSRGLITAIIEDQTGSLWVATGTGLDELNIKTGVFKHFRNGSKDCDSLLDNEFTSMLRDHLGNLWLGTWNGNLHRLDPRTKKFKHFACGKRIGSLVEDYRHIIWAGTSTGLYRSNVTVDSFSKFTDPEVALTSTTIIAGILEDDQKNLWISSSAGIFKFNYLRNEISVYNINQGVDAAGLAFILMRGEKGRSGELFFADRTGYYSFFPDQLKSNTIPPQIIISNFSLADQPVKSGEGSPLTASITQTKEINLNYNQNVFSFDFAGIHYSSPEDNQHLFMLENYENEWRKAGPEKKAWYYNVPPGRYVFHVKASNSYGKWAEKAITLIVHPPWYNTWWAYTLFVVLFLSGLGSFIKWREKTLKKEKTLLEQKVALRTQELEQSIEEKYELSKKVESQQALLNERLRISRELHDDIGSTLGSISIYSEVAKKRAEKNENTNEVLSKIGLASRELIDKMSDIVWSLNPNNESFEQLQNRMMAFAAMMLAPRNIAYDFTGDEELRNIQLTGEQRKNIFLIFKEALYNIVKYAGAKTVSIKLVVQHNNLVMIMQDDGKGFDVSQTNLNETVYAGEYIGGNGIKNMNARADDINAKLCISSKINEGSVVHLTLPL